MDILLDNIINKFDYLKSIDDYNILKENSLYIKKNGIYLICASVFFSKNDYVINLLSIWRKEAKTFHNKFNVTAEGTRKWYKNLLLDIQDRILFFVLDEKENFIGHLGFANLCKKNNFIQIELDNVIRGEKNTKPGAMSIACKELINFAFEDLKVNEVILKTLKSNAHAVNFYKKIGFQEYDKIPLTKIFNDEGFDHKVILNNDLIPDDYFICMKLGKLK